MRKVQPYEYKQGNDKQLYKNPLSKDGQEPSIGYFHTWGKDFEEFEDGAVEITVAIVELENGSIIKLSPELIQFLT